MPEKSYKHGGSKATSIVKVESNDLAIFNSKISLMLSPLPRHYGSHLSQIGYGKKTKMPPSLMSNAVVNAVNLGPIIQGSISLKLNDLPCTLASVQKNRENRNLEKGV